MRRLWGLASLCLLAGCVEPAAAPVADEIRFAAFGLRQPAPSRVCSWTPTGGDAVVIGLPAADGEAGQCDYPVQVQLIGELPPDAELVGPIDPDALVVDAARQQIDVAGASPLERYAMVWIGRGDTDPDTHVAAPFTEGKPTGWHACPNLCVVVFAYRGVAVRVLWNADVHGDNTADMTRRVHRFLDEHSSSTAEVGDAGL